MKNGGVDDGRLVRKEIRDGGFSDILYGSYVKRLFGLELGMDAIDNAV